MWDYISETMPIARKVYYCYLCHQPIQRGEQHVKRVGAPMIGIICTNRMHIECEQVTHDWDDKDWEYHDPIEFVRPKHDTQINLRNW